MSIKDSDFTDLHVHSQMSILDGANRPEELLEISKRLGRKSLALTDHGSIDGWVKFNKAAKTYDIKPIFGIELYMLQDFAGRHDKEKEHKNLHLTALAKTQKGQGKLIQAMGFANTEGWAKAGFAGRPFLPTDYPLANNWAGDIIILSGCFSSPLWNADPDGKLIAEYASVFKDDFYAEVMPIPEWQPQYEVNNKALNAALLYKLQTVVTTDIHYAKQEDSEYHEVILGLSRKGMTWNNPKRWRFDSHSNFVHSAEEIHAALTTMGFDPDTIEDCIRSSQRIADKCDGKLATYPLKLPAVLDEDENKEIAAFKELVFAGLVKKNLADKPNYIERANSEIKTLIDNGFVRYMLMVWDAIKWAKNTGIFIGPARGSAGGSLVVYALNITDVDPIKHNLLFQRFIAPGRNDLPDVDIDIEDKNRHLVEGYLKEKYGQYRVAHVGTFGSMLGKGAIKDVSRLFEVPLEEAEKMSRCIIHRHESDARAHNTIEDTLATEPVAQEFAKKYPKIVHFAQKLEGQIRSVGIHAAGFVISNIDLRNSPNCHLVNRDDKLSVNWDKDDLETMGLIKLDLLGLSTLSALSDALKSIKNRRGISIDLPSLPLDDKKTYDMISRGETATVFQLGTKGPMRYCKDMKPENFEHLIAIAALMKPGPVKAGIHDEYRKCKLGQSTPKYYNEAHKRITEVTYGQIVYQEQIMMLVTDLAGLSWSDADSIRKIIGKQLGSRKWDEYSEKFVTGCKKLKTLEEEEARALWNNLNLFALYALNRSHALGYGLIAYWCAYLKAHYPAEWMCAYLNYGNSGKEDASGELNLDIALREAGRMNIAILPPDLFESDVMWSVDGLGRGNLRVGLKDIKFVGDAAMAQIRKLQEQKTAIKSMADFVKTVDRRAVNKKIVYALLSVGALDNIIPAEENEIWLSNFAEMYESIDKPKKRAAIIPSDNITKDQKDTLLSQFLRFDATAVKSEGMAKDVAARFGLEVIEVDGEVTALREPQSAIIWPVEDILNARLPGASGRLGVSKTDTKKLIEATRKCTKCELREGCKGPVPLDRGAFELMIVAEAPGRSEDSSGKPLVGDSGKVLFDELKRVGIVRSDVYISNTVHCRPPGNGKPTPDQIIMCNWLADEMHLVQPKCVLSLGNSPLFFFTGKESGIRAMNGTTEWNAKYKAYITYGVHPASALYSGDVGEVRRAVEEYAKVVAQFL